MRYQYVKCRFNEAVRALCIGKGTIKQRLFEINQILSALNRSHFPDSLLPDWDVIYEKITRFDPVRDTSGAIVEGRVTNTLKRIRNKSAQEIALCILDLHNELQKINVSKIDQGRQVK